jgi:hypothetical protein
MNKDLQEDFGKLSSIDNGIRSNALQTILTYTDEKVDWLYEVWDDLLAKLDNENSYQRSIAIMVLCNLAKSDREDRLSEALPRLLAHTKDEKFITSRQCIQSIWKAAITNRRNREAVLSHLEKRYRECSDEKHYNLIRQDVIQSIGQIYAEDNDNALQAWSQELIAEETEEKYRKKYTTVGTGKRE